MKKLFSMLLVVSILVITLGVVAISTTAATEVVVWEGDINQEIITSHYIGLINVDSLNQAIREDLAQNGPATKYVLTSTGSYYVGGESNYAVWGFYQEHPEYVETRANSGNSLSEATWTNTQELSKMGQGVFLCIASDGTDTVYVGHVKLVATHEPQPTETEEEPTATGTKPTATPSIRPTQIRDGVTQVYKFTFEDKNAISILKVGDKVIGDVVEWPKGSGNHCLRYQINSETRDRHGFHPYFWPEGIGESLCAQGDLAATGSKIEMKVDFACSDEVRDAYLFPSIVLNDGQETVADRPRWCFPGYGQFSTSTFTWSSYFAPPMEGYENGGIGFCDDMTLPEGAYIYIDNVEFNWIGDWIELDKVFIGYPGGIPCEESDMEIVAPTNPTGTGTETETGAEPTTTATEIEPTATATATATETGAQPTETVTEAEPTETEVQPTETEIQPTETEVQPTETEIQPTETEIQPTDEPTAKPTESKETTEPVIEPTEEPTAEPTVAPTEEPTSEETVAPTDAPTDAPKDVIYGDANGDGTVNMKDVLMIRKYIADLPVDITLDAADANADGVVNMKDVLIVRKYIAGLIDILGA